jgi:hypothetical protein
MISLQGGYEDINEWTGSLQSMATKFLVEKKTIMGKYLS